MSRRRSSTSGPSCSRRARPLTCRGRDYATAVKRARRALAEFRIRGVSTNIP
ncbi:hypothetical protein CTI14_61115, partial [Methylobacterium radiotolerans]